MEVIKACFTLLLIWVFASDSDCIQDSLTDLQAQLRYMAQQLHTCEGDAPSATFDLRLQYLTDSDTICNDGSQAGYYLKESPGSKRWLIYLEGGWFCYDQASCDQRRANPRMRSLMTSKHWSLLKRGSGMLSPQPDENPSWWNANHVLVPYCSSDAWSGNASSHETGGKFSFLGSRIIDKVIEDLLPRGLYHAKHLLLAGSSAGGIGVILNLDRVAQKLHKLGSAVQVRGLADSGWYLADSPFKPTCPSGVKDCGPMLTIKKGMTFWRGIVPENCTKEHAAEPWKCYFGEIVYPTISTPLFVFQWLYDEAQLVLDGSFQPRSLDKIDRKQIMNIFNIGVKLRESIKKAKVRNVFSPACISHTILTHNNWLKFRLKGSSLNDAINCWYLSSGHNRGQSRRNHSIGRHHKSGHCPTHRVDQCSYPLCNPTCPFPRNPFTGKQYPIKLPQMPGIPLPLTPASINTPPRLKP